MCALTGCNNTPVALASGQSFPSSIGVDATNVYWANTGTGSTDGSIMKCAIGGCGGVPTPLASNLYLPETLVVDDVNVYFMTNEGGAGVLYKVPVGGGTVVTMLAGMMPKPLHLAQDAKSLYWTNANNEVNKVAK
jgi:hypothetical protein